MPRLTLPSASAFTVTFTSASASASTLPSASTSALPRFTLPRLTLPSASTSALPRFTLPRLMLPLATLTLTIMFMFMFMFAAGGQVAIGADLSIYSTPAESIRIANKYMANNKTDQAIDEYSKTLGKILGIGGENGEGNQGTSALSLSPNNIALQLETYLQRSTAYQQLGDLGAAIDDLSALIELNPEYKNALQQRANLYQTQGNYQEALTDLQRNSIINPESNSIAEIARIYLEQGDYGNSILEAQKALRLNSSDHDALLTLAKANDATNNHTGALTLYKQYQAWANASPQNRKQSEDIASKIAETFLALGDTENGTKEGEKLITQNRATTTLIQKLLEIYKDNNDTENTTRMESALNKKQRNLTPKQQYDLAVTAFRRMDYEEALRLVNLAIEQNNNIRPYRLLKVQSLIYMQNKNEACAEAAQLCEDGYCPTITKLQNSNYCSSM